MIEIVLELTIQTRSSNISSQPHPTLSVRFTTINRHDRRLSRPSQPTIPNARSRRLHPRLPLLLFPTFLARRSNRHLLVNLLPHSFITQYQSQQRHITTTTTAAASPFIVRTSGNNRRPPTFMEPICRGRTTARTAGVGGSEDCCRVSGG